MKLCLDCGRMYIDIYTVCGHCGSKNFMGLSSEEYGALLVEWREDRVRVYNRDFAGAKCKHHKCNMCLLKKSCTEKVKTDVC